MMPAPGVGEQAILVAGATTARAPVQRVEPGGAERDAALLS